MIDKTTSQLAEKAKLLGVRAQERIERELVDDRFAALREMVTGSAQAAGDSQAAPAEAGKTGLDGIATLGGKHLPFERLSGVVTTRSISSPFLAPSRV